MLLCENAASVRVLCGVTESSGWDLRLNLGLPDVDAVLLPRCDPEPVGELSRFGLD
jgi:hypothetical protein